MAKLTPQQKRVKKVLQDVVRILNAGGAEVVGPSRHASRQLWHVLTALRGPDDGHDALKSETTSRIRGAIGLEAGNAGGAMISYKPLVPVHSLKSFTDKTSWHFRHHYHTAYEALAELGFIKS